MNLEEIKSLLTKISPWPWNPCSWDPLEKPHVTSKTQNQEHVCRGKYDLPLSSFDANFISQSPQIISDLIKEIETYKYELEEVCFEKAKLLGGLENSINRIKELKLKLQAARNVAITMLTKYEYCSTHKDQYRDKVYEEELPKQIDWHIAEEEKRLRGK